MNKNRKACQEYIINSINMIDKDNGKRYKDFFSKLSDKDFDKYIKAIENKESAIMLYKPNLYKSFTNKKLFTLAKRFKIILFDKLRFRNFFTGKYFYSNYKFLILRLPIRRVKQYLFDKISLPESDQHVSKLSGQVMKPDKGSKISLIETYMLSNRKLEKSILEFIKVRGGDLEAYNKFKNQILEMDLFILVI